MFWGEMKINMFEDHIPILWGQTRGLYVFKKIEEKNWMGQFKEIDIACVGILLLPKQ